MQLHTFLRNAGRLPSLPVTAQQSKPYDYKTWRIIGPAESLRSGDQGFDRIFKKWLDVDMEGRLNDVQGDSQAAGRVNQHDAKPLSLRARQAPIASGREAAK